MSYFVDIGNKDCFAATLYVCFDLLRPDVVAEMVSSITALHIASFDGIFCLSPGDMA